LPLRSGGSDLKRRAMLLFFLIVFSVYGLINFYIGLRFWQALPVQSPWRTVFLCAFLVISLSFLAGRFLERAWVSPLSEGLVWIGSFHLAAMLYLFLALFLLDVLRLVLWIFPGSLAGALQTYRGWILFGLMTGVGLLILFGHLNALHPRLRSMELSLAKPFGARNMRVAVISDIHLGTIIGRRHLDRIVQMVNDLQADLILLPGDIVDEDLGPVIRENLGESLGSMKARYGVYAVTGNHEYIGGADAACHYLEDHGITVLRDSAVTLSNGIQIIGREDRSIRQFAGKERKSLTELLKGLDRGQPLLLLDHQPFHLDEGVQAGIDLQLSGHTHHGQLWPLNYLTQAIYELSWGYLRRGSTHIYVSCGVGTWGPPVRTGNSPEILLFTLRGREE
jgi:predicted MPP superfamily phosphohydrolase